MSIISDKSYEIADDKRTIFKGSLDKMIYAWNINYLADFAFKEIYGHINRDPQLIIKKWNGSLRLIRVIEMIPYKPGENKTWLKNIPIQSKK